MVFLSGFTDSALLVVVTLFLLVVIIFYAHVIGVLFLFKKSNFYDSWFKKVLIFILSILILQILLYLHFTISGKGLLQ